MDNWIEEQKKLHEEATVSKFALLVGKSKPVISERLKNNIIFQGDSYLQWLHQYVEHLSAVAGGRGGDKQEQLTEARIAELETKAGINRLIYHEKIENLVSVEVAYAGMIDWASYTNRQIGSAFEQYTHEIEHKHGITVDPKMREEIAGSAINRIKEYAKKLGEGLTGGS